MKVNEHRVCAEAGFRGIGVFRVRETMMTTDCPTVETLALFILDIRDSDIRDGDGDAGDVAEHADQCQSCRQLLSALLIECAAERVENGSSLPRADAELSDREPILRAGDMVGRYRVVSRIGRGAMGTVYSAFDSELDRDVAIKMTLRPGDEAFRREGQALAKLDHPNAVTVYDVGESHGSQYIAMQLIAGIDLGRWLSYGNRPESKILAVVRDVASALAEAHRNGIVHRDVKPENIFVGDDGKVAIGDFGLAMAADETKRVGAGTPAYMAPEVLAGEPATAASDQFSLAVTTITALTGRRPHQVTRDGDDFRITKRQSNDEPKLDRHVRATLDRALADDPTDRFASLDDFARGLAPPQSRWPRFALAAAVIVSLALLMFIATREQKESVRTCSQAGNAVAENWSSAQRDRLRERASAHSHLTPAIETTIAVLDRYAISLERGARASCLDTRAGVQGPALELRRRDCLEVRIGALGALATALENGGPRIWLRAPLAVRELPSPTDCTNLEALAETVPLPIDEGARKRIASLRKQLDALDAAIYLGDEKVAATKLDELESLAGSVKHAPTQARYLHTRAEVLHRRGELELAEETLGEATEQAALGKDDRLAARIWLTRAGLVGYKRRETKRALAMLETIRAAVARAGNTPELRANLANTEGLIRDFGGQYDRALVLYRKAHTLASDALGKDHPKTISSLRNVAIIEAELGNDGEAAKTWARVLELQQSVFGSSHPEVARTRGALSLIALRDRDFARAEALATEALKTLTTSLGSGHPSTLLAMQRLAGVHSERGRPTKALELDRKVQAATEKLYGSEHPRTLDAISDLISSLRLAGEHDEAVDLGQRALEIAVRVRSQDLRFLGSLRNNLANALASAGRKPEAVEQLRESLKLKRKTFGSVHPALISGIGNLTELLCETNQVDNGIKEASSGLTIARETNSPALGWLLMTRAGCFLRKDLGALAYRDAKEGYDLLFESAGSDLERAELSETLAKTMIATRDSGGPAMLRKTVAHYQAAGDPGSEALKSLTVWALARKLVLE